MIYGRAKTFVDRVWQSIKDWRFLAVNWWIEKYERKYKSNEIVFLDFLCGTFINFFWKGIEGCLSISLYLFILPSLLVAAFTVTRARQAMGSMTWICNARPMAALIQNVSVTPYHTTLLATFSCLEASHLPTEKFSVAVFWDVIICMRRRGNAVKAGKSFWDLRVHNFLWA